MISKNQIKLIQSLQHKKNRDELGLFVAEGSKLVLDLLPAFQHKWLFATEDWLFEHDSPDTPIEKISQEEFKKISSQKSPQGVLAVFEKPKQNLQSKSHTEQLCLALDDVQDPGNLGTIIRIADWFGIENIFCSLHSADAFSPKTVQSTMGSLARVKVYYIDLLDFINKLPTGHPIYGTFMAETSIYNQKLNTKGLIVLGNEGNGISEAIANHVTQRITIPNFPKNNATAESLNVAVAAAIVCSEFRRNKP
ncbi:MAG: RNA methyltransferase [Porphyromonadaceae bacterium CG2_30_38_12]|nr:MAG: RNA methyltransferase [Porphyromonadaceae bacterium CG2_30_38_12]